MSTDRELLDLAAKAAGRSGYRYVEPDIERRLREDRGIHVWNPLTDDGDALRLAVKLGMKVCVDLDEGATRILNVYDGLICMHMHFDVSAESSTRRAIVRAAAEIGRAMP